MRSSVSLKLLCLASIVFLLLSGFSALAAPVGPGAAGAAGSALDRLKAEAGDVEVSVKRSLDVASFVRLTGNRGTLSLAGESIEERARAFFAAYGELFGIRDASTELRTRPVLRDIAGGVHAPFSQTYHGLAVFGGELIAHFDADGRLVAANGTFVPNIAVSVQPALTSRQAELAALQAVQTANADATSQAFDVQSSELLIYRRGLAQGVRGESYLAYRVEVTNRVDVREQAFIDAASGALLDRFPMIDNSLYRELYSPTLSPADLKWKEGDPWPSDTEYQNILNGTGEAYNLFGSMTNGAWLSYNGSDAIMKTIAKYNPGGGYCPNASWNGINTQFCNQVSGDDTVAHEWGHAYTEYTHNLIYAWQPGALNESYSDIWGETVDLLNGRGKDSPNSLRKSDGSACSQLACASQQPKTDNTYRWVSGEDDPGFRCPIRDMWRPECYSNPGKVISSFYQCTSDDGGVCTITRVCLTTPLH